MENYFNFRADNSKSSNQLRRINFPFSPQEFKKNTINKISLIISFLLQVFYIPSIAANFNAIKNITVSYSFSQITTAIFLTIIILSSQLIIMVLQNLHLFSIKAKSFGKNLFTNPLLICWQHNFLFPFVYQTKWVLFVTDILSLVIIGCLLFKYPRICQQFDKWLKIYISTFVSAQIFILIQSFQSGSIFSINLTFLAISSSLAIYFLV